MIGGGPIGGFPIAGTAGQISTYVVAVDALTQTTATSNATVSVEYTITVQELTQVQAMDTATLTQAHILAANDLAQVQSIDNASLSVAAVIAVAGLVQQGILDPVTLSGLNWILSGENLAQVQAIDSASLAEHAVITVENLTQAQILDVVSLGGVVVGELEGTLVLYGLVGGMPRSYAIMNADATAAAMMGATVDSETAVDGEISSGAVLAADPNTVH